MIKAKNITICAVLFVILQCTGLLTDILFGYFDLSWLLDSLFMMAMAILLTTTYKSHAKNVMKPLIGGALILITEYEIYGACDFIQQFDFYSVDYNSPTIFAVYCGLQVVMALAMLLIFIIHLVINMKHESSQGLVKSNRILFVVFALAAVAKIVVGLIGIPEVHNFISWAITGLSDAFLIAEVIIIEGLVDNFRADRENAGWTEEKGYPEGYVHQRDR